MDSTQLDLWKQKVLAGEALTAEEYHAVVDILRKGQRAAAEAGARKRAAKGPARSADELMSELEALNDAEEQKDGQ